MAKRSAKTKAELNSSTTEVNPAEAMAIELRGEFYKANNRNLRLDSDELTKLVSDLVKDGEEHDLDWWFKSFTKAEEAKAKAIMAEDQKKRIPKDGKSINQLLEIYNQDGQAQTFAAHVAETNDLKPKAPAFIAWRLSQDFSAKDRASFAIPYSNEETRLDGDKNKIGDNELPSFATRWDRQYHKTADGSMIDTYWYADFVKGSVAGAPIVKMIDQLNPNTINDDSNKSVVIDGKHINVHELGDEQRKSLYQMMKQRLDAIIELHRKAMQVLNKWDMIEDRFGNKYDKDGNITQLGILAIDWVWVDPMNLDKGVSPTKKPIRMCPLFQKDVKVKDKDGNETVKFKAGTMRTDARDLLISEFININVEAAFVNAGKARGPEATPRFNELIEARKIKAPEPTAPGEKQPEGSAKVELPTAKATVQAFHNIRLQLETDGYRKALLELTDPTSGQLPKDQLKMLCYDVVEMMNWLSENFVTKEVNALHDIVEREKKNALDKERDEKMAKLRDA